MSRSLTLRVPAEDRTLTFVPGRLIVAGYTGADDDRVQEHIRELAGEGVPPPDSVPAFYDLDPALLVTDQENLIAPPRSSGEVEPVLIITVGGRFLGVGSDHTDRERERTDIRASKAVCPKVIGGSVLPTERVTDLWQDATLRSWTHGDGGRVLYQTGHAGDLRRPEDILALLQERVGVSEHGLVVFLGTVPLLKGGFRYSKEFEGEFAVPGYQPLTVQYQVSHRSAS